jgi:hypothetical protein
LYSFYCFVLENRLMRSEAVVDVVPEAQTRRSPMRSPFCHGLLPFPEESSPHVSPPDGPSTGRLPEGDCLSSSGSCHQNPLLPHHFPAFHPLVRSTPHTRMQGLLLPLSQAQQPPSALPLLGSGGNVALNAIPKPLPRDAALQPWNLALEPSC